MKEFIKYLRSLGVIQDEKKLKNIKPDRFYDTDLESDKIEVKEVKVEDIRF